MLRCAHKFVGTIVPNNNNNSNQQRKFLVSAVLAIHASSKLPSLITIPATQQKLRSLSIIIAKAKIFTRPAPPSTTELPRSNLLRGQINNHKPLLIQASFSIQRQQRAYGTKVNEIFQSLPNVPGARTSRCNNAKSTPLIIAAVIQKRCQFYDPRYRVVYQEPNVKSVTPFDRLKRYRKLLAIIGALFLLFILTHLEKAPVTGRLRVIAVSPETEAQLGIQEFENVMRVMSDRVLPANHPATRLVRRVGERIVAVTGQTGFDWKFVVVDSPEVNAFCLPSGKVVVFTGLLKKVTEPQLALVMGHEIAHALARHPAEKVTFGGILVFLRLMINLFLGTSGEMFGVLSNFILFLPNSRRMEMEADHIGLLLIARACYNPLEAIGMYEVLAKAAPSAPAYISTHPSHQQRVENVAKLLPLAEQEMLEHCVRHPIAGGGERYRHWGDGMPHMKDMGYKKW